jgi:hypothetical protein
MQYLIMLHFPPGKGPQRDVHPRVRRRDEALGRAQQGAAQRRRLGRRERPASRCGDHGPRVRRRPRRHRWPYAETKEILFSFILELPDLDAAIEWVAKMPSTEYGSTEIRPMVGYEPA